MSESWANKYRPKTIDEVVGQDRVKRELQTLNKVGKLPQTIILSGSSGSGKTTLAYLIAKMGKCTHLQEDGSPCDSCENCLNINNLIEKGKSPIGLEVYTYNISKLNRSEDAEEIVESMSKSNTILGYKRYYILDEIQVASQQAQSRFLKVTEDKPKGLYIIMCTTNPEKLSEPLLSRSVMYKLTKPKDTDIIEKLITICNQEGVNYTRSGLALIVKYSNRSVRMSINKAEELSSFGDLNKENVSNHLNLISESMYYDFMNAVKTNNLLNISNIYTTLDENSIGFNDFVKGFGGFIVDLIDISNLIYANIYTKEEIRRYKEYVSQFSDVELMGILSKTKEYSLVNIEDKFMFYSFATELMSILNMNEQELRQEVSVRVTQKELPEINEDVVEKNYKSLTNKVADESNLVTEKEDLELSEDDIITLFGGSEIV